MGKLIATAPSSEMAEQHSARLRTFFAAILDSRRCYTLHRIFTCSGLGSWLVKVSDFIRWRWRGDCGHSAAMGSVPGGGVRKSLAVGAIGPRGSFTRVGGN